jgi:hypothetical protein
MASTRVLASRLASQMATKAARPAARVTIANSSKRTMTGEFWRACRNRNDAVVIQAVDLT